MAMEIDYEQWAENYLDFISMIHDRQIEGSNIFNRCKKWNTLHPGNYAILINIKDNKAEIELYQCYSSVNYRKLLQFTFFSCFNLPLLFRGNNAALSSMVGQSASVYSGELSPIIL